MAAQAPQVDLGFAAPAFSLPATDGKSYGLADLKGDKGTVVAFICNHCPYVVGMVDRLVRDARELAGLGVSTVAICSNDAMSYPEDAFPNMQAFALAHDFPFPYLHDESQEVARAYGAVCTPDLFGFDADLKLAYRGRLDAGRTEPPPPGAKRELLDAMTFVSKTGKAPAEQAASVGCSIKWK
jgi:peroxiredoxin